MLKFPVEVDSKFINEYKLLLTDLVKETIEEVRQGYSHKEYMNKKEASEYIGISFNTLKKFEKDGLPVINVSGLQMIRKNDIDKFLKDRIVSNF